MSILKTSARRGQCQTVRKVVTMYLAQAKRDLAARSYEWCITVYVTFCSPRR